MYIVSTEYIRRYIDGLTSCVKFELFHKGMVLVSFAFFFSDLSRLADPTKEARIYVHVHVHSHSMHTLYYIT